jgi:two-component system CheB/CheR fusion protein
MTTEERARLVAAIEHDMRQPQHSIEMGLRTLRLVVADLRARRFDEATFDSLLQRMTAELASVQAANRQARDTQQDLFDAIRFEFEATPPQNRILRSSDLIERVSKSNRLLAGEIQVRGVRSRLAFVSDERWIERILNNLVGNAIWHSQGRHIVIGARRSGTGIAFEVRDDGRGMPPEEVARVFEPLRTPALSAIASSTARSGLGLYTVRLFAERLGGGVDCYSCMGRGTLFRVNLPGPVTTVEPAPRLIESPSAEAARNKVIAILDDDLSVLRATERAFESLGVEVYADNDPLRWLNVVTDIRRAPDLILLDFQLGTQQCNLHLDIVRRKWTGQKVPVIVVTGHADHLGPIDISRLAPVLRKPLSDQKFNLILDVLAGRLPLPDAGFM